MASFTFLNPFTEKRVFWIQDITVEKTLLHASSIDVILGEKMRTVHSIDYKEIEKSQECSCTGSHLH